MYTTNEKSVHWHTLALRFPISFFGLNSLPTLYLFREREREREGGRDQSLVYFYESSCCKVIMFRLVWNWECAHQSYHLLTLGCQSPSYQKLKRCEISQSGYLKDCTCNWLNSKWNNYNLPMQVFSQGRVAGIRSIRIHHNLIYLH